MANDPDRVTNCAGTRKRPHKQGRFREVPDVLGADDHRNDAPISYAELSEQLRLGRRIIDCVIETITTDDDLLPLYLLFVSCNFRPRGYRIFKVNQYDRPRFFRDMDRLLAMIRNDFFYAVAMSIAVLVHT